MKFYLLASVVFVLTSLPVFAQVPATQPVPDELTDPDTGARIIRLSRFPNERAGVIYFHQPCITADGKYALVRELFPTAGHTAGKMYRYDFSTGQAELIADRLSRNQVMGVKTGNMYYGSDKDKAIYVSNVYTKETRKLADMPAGLVCNSGLAINCDETMIVGVAGEEPPANQPIPTGPPNRGAIFRETFEKKALNIIFSMDTKTREYKEHYRLNAWLGHVQFSPADPTLLMFCHEGPWSRVDRIWNLRLDSGAEPQLMHKREVPTEIAGHEFWSNDGKIVWFDNQYRDGSGRHFLKGRSIETGEVITYPITPEIDSIHYRPSADGTFFIGDGKAKKDDATKQALMLLIPEDGKLKPIKLCSMAKNEYAVAEPNPHITPDQRWVIFTATFSGAPQAWAVETPKQFWRDPSLKQ